MADVRVMTDEDRSAAWELTSTAFGYRDQPMPDTGPGNAPGRYPLGAFDDTGRLVAGALGREQGHWFGGRVVPAVGVAAVAVVPELRGTGLSRLVLTRMLSDARDRGAAISTLFDTTPFPYRRLGWEEVGAQTFLALPTVALAGVRAEKDTILRPATEDDVPAIYEAYRTVARAGTGMMERSGPLFARTPADLLTSFHGVTVAVGADGTLAGYASWDRGPGYDAGGKLTVYDLIGLTPSASAALLAMLGGWASVAPTIVLRVPEDDPALLLISTATATVQSRKPWMLRVVDLPAAVAARGWPAYLDTAIDLEIHDDACPWNAGACRLVLAGGEGRVESGGGGDVVLTERGLSLLYAGAARTPALRRAGLLTGGNDRTDATIDAAFASPRPSLQDYF